ncbi:MAG: hypothetical protein OXF85_00845 [Candidatus Saccharibacteria bacterium]|nr:hypothetical protein [Candidatus Saccharibacteria bacterium]
MSDSQKTAYKPDSPQHSQLTKHFYTRDYTKKWPGLTLKRAKDIGDEIGVDWSIVDLGQFIQGIKEEMEHGTEYGQPTTVHNDDYVTSGRIAYAHLIERPDYYSALELMEQEGDDKFQDSDDLKKAWVADQRQNYQDLWQSSQ